MHTRIKRITSHVGYYRFLQDALKNGQTSEPLGWIPRDLDIRTPYSCGPTHVVYALDGRKVFIAETSHRQYDVFDCSKDVIYRTDDEATDAYLGHPKYRCNGLTFITLAAATKYANDYFHNFNVVLGIEEEK